MKKIWIVFFIVILAGCSKLNTEIKKADTSSTDLSNENNKSNQNVGISQLIGTWESKEDNYRVEISKTSEDNIYKLQFMNNSEDVDIADLTTNDAVLETRNGKFTFTSEIHKLEYSFIVESNNHLSFYFNVVDGENQGISRPTKMEKIHDSTQ